MSAYIVSDDVISVIAKGFLRFRCTYYLGGRNADEIIVNPWKRSDAEKIGQDLLKMNYLSVNERYKEKNSVPKFKFNADIEYTPALLYGCIKEWEYQSCEVPDYKDYWAFICVSWLKDRLTDYLLYKLGYTDDDKRIS